MPPRALSYARRRSQCICQEIQTAQHRSVDDNAKVVVQIIIAAFCPLSFIYIHIINYALR